MPLLSRTKEVLEMSKKETCLREEVMSNVLQLDELGQRYIVALVQGMKLAQESVKQQKETA